MELNSRGEHATAIDKRLAAFDVNEDGSVSIDELLVLAEKQKRLQEKVCIFCVPNHLSCHLDANNHRTICSVAWWLSP